MKLYSSKAYLYDRYVIKKWSLEDIAKECDCSLNTIQNYLVKFDLIRNSRAKR